jgi:hypothetical protein
LDGNGHAASAADLIKTDKRENGGKLFHDNGTPGIPAVVSEGF